MGANSEAVEHMDLERCLSELMGLFGATAQSNEDDWPTLSRTLLDALIATLHVDFAYTRLAASRIETLRFDATSELVARTQSIGDALRFFVQTHHAHVDVLIDGVMVTALRIGDTGDLIVGARRTGFPNPTERTVLTVAANQMAIAFRATVTHDELRRELSERIRIENELRASERGIRLLVDGIPGLVIGLSLSGDIEHANQQALDYFGITLEDMDQRAGRHLIHPHDFARTTQRFREAMAAGTPCELEQRLRRADGVYRWHQTRALPMRDAEGRIEHWYVLNTDIDERKRAEDELRARELSVRLMVDSMESIPAYAIVANEVGEIVFANQQVLDYYGRTLAEVKAWPTSLHIVHPDDLEHANGVVARSLAAGVACEDEYRLRRFDGVYRWFEGRYRPVRDPAGRVINWYVLLIDIDDRKRVERALAAENRVLEMVARDEPLTAMLAELCKAVEEVIDDCCGSVLLLDKDGDVAASAGPCAMATSSKVDIIVHDVETDTRWDSRWRAATLSNGFRSCWVMPILSRTNDVLGVQAVYRRFPGEPNPSQCEFMRQFARLTSIAIERKQTDAAARQSVDDIRRAEAELRRAQGQLVEAQRLSQTGSFTWDVVEDEHVWSEEMCRIFGIDPATKITLETARERIVPEDRAVFEAAVQLGAAGGEPDFSVRITGVGGGVKYLHAVAHRIEGAADRPVFFGAVQDVTEQRIAEDALNRARAELERAARATTLSALTASIAHEVNQPLSGIVTNASTCLRMLATDPPNLDGARATAQRTLRDGNRASEVIQRLRSLFAHQKPKTEQLDLNDAAREVLSLSMSELHNGGVVLRTDFADNLPRMTGDRIQLQQVILNLVANAVDAMKTVDDRSRELLITTAGDRAQGLRLSVRDSGVGIDTATAERMFDAFYTTKTDGMGVGLAISRSIIESHNGRLWASANDGPGATFTFSIPADSNVPDSVPR